MNDVASQLCLWAEQHRMTLVPRHLPDHLNVYADSLSRRHQILGTEWSVNQSIMDRVFSHWGRPHVDLFALSCNTKLTTFMSPIWQKDGWKVDSLVHSWEGMYAYAYPPTSLIRACLNKIQSDKALVILVAPLWPNQEWFTDLVGLAIDFPINLPHVPRLLKQTFSHQFHKTPQTLNLHAWLLSPEPRKRGAFLDKCPGGSLYLRKGLLLDSTRLSGRSSENGVGLKDLILAHPLFQ